MGRLVALLIALALIATVVLIAEKMDDQPEAFRVHSTNEAMGWPTDAWASFTTPETTTTTIAKPKPRVRLIPKARTGPSVKPSYQGDMPSLIRSVFSRFGAGVAEQAVRVSQCETGGTFSPRSTGSQGERGLFQIHPKYHQDRIRSLGFTWDQMYEPGPNAQVAASLYGDKGWQPWTCRYAA